MRQALLIMDEVAGEIPESPLLHHYRAKAYVAMGESTGEREWYRHATQAELTAIGAGYARDETFRVAVYACVKGQDHEGFRALRDLAQAKGYASEALERASRTLGVE